jgi:hypothetical protein
MLIASLALGALAGWLGWNLRLAEQRARLLAQPGVYAWDAGIDSGALPHWPPLMHDFGKLPLGLWLAGEWPRKQIELVHYGGVRFSDDDLDLYRRAFPEATVTLVRPEGNAILPIR